MNKKLENIEELDRIVQESAKAAVKEAVAELRKKGLPVAVAGPSARKVVVREVRGRATADIAAAIEKSAAPAAREVARSRVVSNATADLAAASEPVRPVVLSAERSVPLFPIENKIQAMLLSGLQEREIASKLKISENDMRGHLKNIFKKLNVKNKAGLLARLRKTKRGPSPA